jgi:hypothetical protein
MVGNPEITADFFGMTGMGEREVVHCTWDDVSFVHGTVAVQWKKDFGRQPKAYRERDSHS